MEVKKEADTKIAGYFKQIKQGDRKERLALTAMKY